MALTHAINQCSKHQRWTNLSKNQSTGQLRYFVIVIILLLFCNLFHYDYIITDLTET